MKARFFAIVCVFGMVCAGALDAAETKVPMDGPAKNGSPGWYIAGSAADPEGPLAPPRAGRAGVAEAGGGEEGGGAGRVSGYPPRCAHSIVCEMDGTRGGGVSAGEEGNRTVWKHTPGLSYSVSYPFDLPAGGGDVASVAVDSKDNVWIYQRNKPENPALFKFGPDHKLLFTIPSDVYDHSGPFRAHGMNVDPEDNVWIADEAGAVVEKFSADGKHLLTLGTKGRRGDWDEAKGQRLLWEPVALAFNNQNGDVYIFEGHGDQSPNDVGSSDTANTIGAARVLHLDKNGNFINQWYGNARGPGKFNNTHGSAVDPDTGDVWVGDRQDYRIVVFNANGQFIRTIQSRNLICALYFDKHPGARHGQLWQATGQDGQIVRIDRNAKVLFVAGGTRKSLAPDHFSEATYLGADSKGNLMVGDTQNSRATELSPPAKAGKN